MYETKPAPSLQASSHRARGASAPRRRIAVVVITVVVVMSGCFGALLGCGAIQWIPDRPDEPPAPPTPEGPRLSRVDADAGDDVTPSDESKTSP